MGAFLAGFNSSYINCAQCGPVPSPDHLDQAGPLQQRQQESNGSHSHPGIKGQTSGTRVGDGGLAILPKHDGNQDSLTL